MDDEKCRWYKSFIHEIPGRGEGGMQTAGESTKIPFCAHPKHSRISREAFKENNMPRDKWLKCDGDPDSSDCELTIDEILDF